MKCKYCQAEVAPKSKICCNCGRFIGEETDELIAKRNSKRKLFIGIGIVLIAAVFILTTFGMSYFQQRATNEQLEKQVAVTSANNLGMTLEELEKSFNHNEFANRAQLKINAPQLIKGEKNTQFQNIFTEKLALNGIIGKLDHKLLALQLIAIPSNVKDDQVRMVTTMGILIDTFSPDVPKQERSKILQELGFDKDTDLYKANNVAVRGNVRYSFKFVENTGFVFWVANVNFQG